MKVVVLGGGPAGCSAAYFLRQKGLTDITIVETDDIGCAGVPGLWSGPHLQRAA